MGGSWLLLPRPPAHAPPPGACPFWGRGFRAGGHEAGARRRVERPGRAGLFAGRLDHAGRPHLLQTPAERQHRYRYRHPQRGLRSPPGAGEVALRESPLGARRVRGGACLGGGACMRESSAAGGSWALLAGRDLLGSVQSRSHHFPAGESNAGCCPPAPRGTSGCAAAG